jgi:hypothetical protein
MRYTHFERPLYKGRASVPTIEPQIIRAARNMIQNHGADADAIAEKRARNLSAYNKLDAAATWHQIAIAIRQLASAPPVVDRPAGQAPAQRP